MRAARGPWGAREATGGGQCRSLREHNAAFSHALLELKPLIRGTEVVVGVAILSGDVGVEAAGALVRPASDRWRTMDAHALTALSPRRAGALLLLLPLGLPLTLCLASALHLRLLDLFSAWRWRGVALATPSIPRGKHQKGPRRPRPAAGLARRRGGSRASSVTFPSARAGPRCRGGTSILIRGFDPLQDVIDSGVPLMRAGVAERESATPLGRRLG